jgi:hypothetical protein
MNEMISMERKELHGFMDFSNLERAMQCANILAESDLVPVKYKKKANDILVAIQMGKELGLQPLQSLREINVVNGKPSLEAEAMLALVKCSPQYEYCHEAFNQETETASCTIKRKNEPEYIVLFSMADAKKAGLANKAGTWQTHPKRMLMHRARSFALRDKFPDVIRGLCLPEEAKESPPERDITPQFIAQGYGHPISLGTGDVIKGKLTQSRMHTANSDINVLILPGNELPTEDCPSQNIETNESVSSDTLEELELLTTNLQVTDEEKGKWLTKAKVSDLSQLSETQANLLIEMLLKRMA